MRVVGPAAHVKIVVVHGLANVASSISFSILNATVSTILIHLLVSIEVEGHSCRSMLQTVVLFVIR